MNLDLAKLSLLAFYMFGCAGRVPPAATTTAEEAREAGGALIPLASRTTPDGEVTAVWMGADPGVGVGPDSPVGLWIHEIHFHFGADDPAPLRYAAPYDPDSMTFEIFSPDGAHVALAQGRGVTFHLVPIAALRAYLTDPRTAPHEVVNGQRTPSGEAAFAHEPRWLTERMFEFEAVCNAESWQVTHVLGGATEITPKPAAAAEPEAAAEAPAPAP
jgi:hypothetical protein